MVKNTLVSPLLNKQISQYFKNKLISLKWYLAMYKGIARGIITYYTRGPEYPSWSLKSQSIIHALKAMDKVDVYPSLKFYRDHGNKLTTSTCNSTTSKKSKIPRKFRALAHKLVKYYLEPRLGSEIFDSLNHWDNSKPLEIEWLVPKNLELNAKTPILVYFHGGGFFEGSFSTYREPVGKLVSRAGILGLGLNYRLAPEFTFPCQLEDALATIIYLTSNTSNSGFGSSLNKIIAMGDSSGGHLVSILSHYMRDQNLGKLSGSVLWSPVLDITRSQLSARDPNTKDFLEPFWRILPGNRLTVDNDPSFRLLYNGTTKEIRDRMDRDGHYLCKIEHVNYPLVSPFCDSDFSNLPPMLIQTGMSEVFRDEAYLYAKKIYNSQCTKNSENIKIQLFEEMPHCFMMVPGFDKEENCLREALKFIRKCLELDQLGDSEGSNKSSGRFECYIVNTKSEIRHYVPDFKLDPISARTWR